MARHRCSNWLLTFLISLPFSLHAGAPAWQAELEKIQVQSKSQPHEANILIDRWLRQISPTELELREQLINTKAYNLIILSEHNNVGQSLQAWRDEMQAVAPRGPPLGGVHLDTHPNLDINTSATIVKLPFDTERQGFSYANAPQSVGVCRHHTELPRG